MDYQINDQIEKLQTFLAQSTGDPNAPRQVKEIPDEEVLWDCSRFFASVLHLSSIHPGAATDSGFLTFKSAYEVANAVIIDAQKLFDTYWLRKSFGHIHIAGAVSYSCMNFQDISAYRRELQFISEIQSTDPQNDMDLLKYEQAVFEQRVVDYEQANGVVLDRNGIYFQRWCSKKDGRYSFSNIEAHFQRYLNNWDAFAFLCAYKAELQKIDKTFLLIKERTLKKLHKSFSELFSQMPSLADLIAKNIFHSGKGGYLLDFSGDGSVYWTALACQISGRLWTFIYQDPAIADKQQGLKDWLYKTRFLNCRDALQLTTKQARLGFCDEAFLLLQTEDDLGTGKDEITKMLLDGTYAHGNTDLNRFTRSLELSGKNAYEIYIGLTDGTWDSLNFLYDQRSRVETIKLISTYVLHEREHIQLFNPDGSIKEHERFGRIKFLVRLGPERPFLLWKMSYVMLHYRQEILPLLFLDPELASLGFVLADELLFNQDQAIKNKELWQKVTSLFLASATGLGFSHEETAGTIFNLFIELNKEKYLIPYRPQRRKAGISQESADFRSERERIILDRIADAPLNGNVYYHSGHSPYLLPEVFGKLAEKFVAYDPPERYQNGTIQFPMAQWDGLLWLMEVATYHRFKTQFQVKPPDVRMLSETFMRSYIGLMETVETIVFDFQSRTEKPGLPNWSESIERLDRLNWLFPVYNLYEFGMLDQFLSPRIVMEKAEDIYHKGNKLKASQLRTHVGVLLQVLKKMVLPSIPFGFEKIKLEKIRLRLETRLVEYVKDYGFNDPGAGRLDLFEFNKEESLFGGTTEALLPQLARAINWFSDKAPIIAAIQNSGDLHKLLTIGEWIASQGIKQKLLEQAGKTDVFELLEKQRWIPEIQSILLKISQYPELINKIEDSLLYFEETVADHSKQEEYKIVAYRVRLLLAYFNKDESQLKKEAVPVRQYQHHDGGDLSDREYKEFYLGLILLHKRPEEAYPIFNQLFSRYPNLPSIALNRLVAAYNIGDQNSDTDQYALALAEWMEAARAYESKALEKLEPNVSVILMNIYFRLNEYEKLDDLFNGLDLPYKLHPNILEVWVDGLVARERRAEAFYWIESGKRFHQFADVADIDFIRDLQVKVRGEDNVDELIVQYNRIFNSLPEKLIRILPEKLNGKRDMTEFISQEFVYAADKMLEKIKSIDVIDNEDKYNDLIEIIMESRVSGYGWKVSGQKRGGYSGANGPQAGERDLPIIGADDKILMNGEALVYRIDKTVPHLNKMFNYYHQKERLLVLFYDTGKEGSDFQANWEHYKNKILPKCKFVKGHEPVGLFTDVSADYKVQNSAIKVGKTVLKSGGLIIHVFVNINYHLPPVAKTS